MERKLPKINFWKLTPPPDDTHNHEDSEALQQNTQSHQMLGPRGASAAHHIDEAKA
jgi:hypothetical protein